MFIELGVIIVIIVVFLWWNSKEKYTPVTYTTMTGTIFQFTPKYWAIFPNNTTVKAQFVVTGYVFSKYYIVYENPVTKKTMSAPLSNALVSALKSSGVKFDFLRESPMIRQSDPITTLNVKPMSN